MMSAHPLRQSSAARYLIQLAHEHLDFRIPELESLCSLVGKNLHEIWDKSFILTSENLSNDGDMPAHDVAYNEKTTPYVVLKNISESDTLSIMSRSMFAKHAYEVWGHGETYKDLKESLLEYPKASKEPFMRCDSSFCIRVKAHGRKIALAEQVEKIDRLEDVLPFAGNVDLKSPRNEFHIIEDYGACTGQKKLRPHYLYFGRLIAKGQRELIQNYSVKKRKFIGNTSMDAGLSFIMSNLAKIKADDYICDPFVGTGSLLIAAAHNGACVTGGDINYNILHARGKSSRVGAGYRQKDETIQDSLRQYGLQDKYIDVLLHDAAKHPWCYSRRSSGGIFDAIVTDPPYGIRESCSRVGTEKENSADPNDFDVHHPERTAYHLDRVFADLLIFASYTLVPRGRLVYWIPIYRPDYQDDYIPTHPRLKLIYNCEQHLKRDTSRRLIVMEKIDGAISIEQGSSTVCRNGMYKGHNAFRDKYFKAKKEK